MVENSVGEFARYLQQKNFIAADSTSILDFSFSDGGERSLKKLWELTELGANDFAEEVARFFGLPRLSLVDLLSVTVLLQGFSRRFLREMQILGELRHPNIVSFQDSGEADGQVYFTMEYFRASDAERLLAKLHDLGDVSGGPAGEIQRVGLGRLDVVYKSLI